MSGVNYELEELKHKTERTEAVLSALHRKLGHLAYGYHDVIGYQPSQEFYDRLCEVLEESENIARQKNLTDYGIETERKGRLCLKSRIKGFSKLMKFRDLKKKSGSVEQRLENLYSDYGACLAEGVDSWLAPDAPGELLEICDRIREERIRLEQFNMNADYLMMEKEIEVHDARCDVLEKQVEHLNIQQSLIKTQIAELEEKIGTEKKSVETLRCRQQKLTMRAKSLK